jgi:hypothetical protein
MKICGLYLSKSAMTVANGKVDEAVVKSFQGNNYQPSDLNLISRLYL